MMLRAPVYVVLGLTVLAAPVARASGSFSLASTDLVSASTIRSSSSIAHPSGLTLGTTTVGAVSLALELEELAPEARAPVTLSVSAVVAGPGGLRIWAAPEGARDDPAILLSLMAYPVLRVLSAFPMSEMWLLREAFIESDRTSERMARAADLSWSREIDHLLPWFDQIRILQAIRQQAIQQSQALSDPGVQYPQAIAQAAPPQSFGEDF
jgi:hypothetical protein